MLGDVFAAEKGGTDEQQAEVALLGGLLDLLVPLFAGKDVGILPSLEGEVLAGTQLLIEFSEELVRQFAIVMRIGEEVTDDALRFGRIGFHAGLEDSAVESADEEAGEGAV